MISKKNIILISLFFITIFILMGGYFYLAKKKTSVIQPVSTLDKGELSQRFDIIHYDYSEIQWPMEVSGKIAYLVIRGDEAKIIYDNQEYLKFNRTEGWPTKLLNINGKIGYILRKDKQEFLGIEGQIISKGYDSIEKVFAEPDNTIYLKVKNKDKRFIVKNKEIIYADALNADLELTNENKVAILLKYPNELRLIYNEQKYIFPDANYLGFVSVWNGKLIYILGENGKRILIYGDEKIKDSRGDITSYRIINNELAYTVLINQEPINVFRIVYKNELIGKKYLTIYRHFGIREFPFIDHLIYIAVTKDSKMLMVKDNKEISPPYEEILVQDNNYPLIINNKIAFVVRQNNEEFIVYDGEELPHYQTINFLTSVDNKLVFVAIDKDFNSYLFIEK